MDNKNIFYKLNPYIRRAMFHKASKLSLKSRIIFDYELLYLSKGRLKVFIGDKEYEISPGSMVLFKPGKRHEFITIGGEETHMPHIHFDAAFYNNFENVPINFKPLEQCSEEELGWIREDILGESLGFPDIIDIDNHHEIYNLLLEIIDYYEKGDSDSLIIQKALLLKILYLIHTGLKAKSDKTLFRNSRNLELAVKYIIEHYNEKIYIDHLAKVACLSCYHFERLFKRKYGLSPQGFQIRYRIEKSKELIKFTSMSLVHIAEKVGYGDIHSFNKAFRRLAEVSPSKFREHL